MLAIGIRYLNGFVVASHGQHEQVEWPPHPGRVFMAMAAAHFQTGASAAERGALLWLEALPEAPVIYAAEALPRTVVTQFVPVNDKAGPAKALMHSLPLTRDRQPRTFARAWLPDDTVWFQWLHAEPCVAVREALAALCANVTRIGHSSSLVEMWLADSVPSDAPRWVSDDDRATAFLRVTAAGTLEALERDFNGGAVARYEELLLAVEAAPSKKAAQAARKMLTAEYPDGPPFRQRPRLSVYQGYSRAQEGLERPVVRGSVFSPNLLVFALERVDGPYRHLDLSCTLAVTETWRKALVSQANELGPQARSVISGHNAEGGPLEQPHMALLPLPVVGHAHADGHLLGVALILPADLAAALRTEVLRAVGRVTELQLGRLGRWRLNSEGMVRPPAALQPQAWTAHPDGAARWGTVTPVVFDQHPKAKDKCAYVSEVTAMFIAACERIELPRPREVIVTPVSTHLGAPPAHACPRLQRKDRSERRHSHAILIFDEPVRGPILIGAGRYRGYGLCRPLEVEA